MRRVLVWIILLALVIPLISCGEISNEAPDGKLTYSYKDIPGVTQGEIDAVEAIKAKRGGFSYGHLVTTEAFKQTDGTYAGFTIEVCKLLSDMFDTPFSPCAYDEWSALKSDIDSGATDFSGDFTHTAERMQIYEMTTPIAGRRLKIYNLTGSPEIASEADMNGMKVGFFGGAVAAELIIKLYPSCSFEIVDISSFSDAADMLESGEIDAFVMDGVSDTMFEENKNIRSKDIFQFAYAPVSITSKNHELEPVISVINKYLASGGMQMMFELYRQSDFEYKKRRLALSFTDEERAYLADLKARNAQVNVALQHDAYPASFYNAMEKRYDGAAYDILTEVGELTGIVFNSDCMPVEKPLSDILDKLKSGEVSMMPQLLYSESRKDDYIWSRVSYITTHYAMLSKWEYPVIQPFQVYYANVGTINKSAHEELFREFFPDHEKNLAYQTGDEGFDALERGEIDLLMLAETMLLVQTNYREKLGYKVNITFDKELDTLFGFNKDEVILRDIFDKSLAYIDVKDIEESWLSRSFDYQSKMIKDSIPFIVLFVALLLAALFVVLLFYMKNRRLSKSLEGTVKERTRKLERQTAALEKRLEQQRLMAALSQNFIIDGNMEEQISASLKLIGEFMGISRVLLMKFNEQSLHYLHEWDNPAQNIKSKRGMILHIEDSEMQLIAAYSQRVLAHFNLDDGNRGDFIQRYRLYDIENLLMLPIYDGNDFWGILEFDQCEKYSKWTASDINLGEMVSGILSGVITRRNIEDKLVEAKELAEQNSKAKSEFLSRMSHEMRTPMNAIIGMTSIGKTSADVERKDYCLDKIDTASTHLLGVINDVLDMSKIEAGKFELSAIDFSLEKMLIKITNVINFRMEEKNQFFTVKVEPDVPQAIISDEQHLNQIITNLLGNAVKFTPENGAISLFVRKISEENDLYTLQFEVKDTGIGISEEQQKRLFTSFEQADGSVSRKYGGTGLGLAISKHIVEMMDGKIWIESKLGEGSSFIFTIRAKKGRSKANSLRADINLKNLRILAVDDDKDVREYFSSLASSLKLQCETASSGEEACAMIEQRAPFNIFFVDWKMPHMNGIELTKWIKNRYHENSVVIMISATEWSYIEDEAKLAGVDRFMPKPLFASVIAECINECIFNSHTKAADGGGRDGKGCFKDRHILLAEDIAINQEIAIALLESTGIRIDCAGDGGKAYRMFMANPDYDMIFMDIQMPETDGYNATKMIRALDDPRAKSIPIVAMTANVFREDIERCKSAGMNDHIGKPIDRSDLIAMLKKWLPDSQPETAPISVDSLKENSDSQLLQDAARLGMDIDTALKRLGGMQSVLEQSIKNMARSIDEKIKAMDGFIAVSNLERFSIDAHGFKSSLASIGAAELSELAAELETLANANDHPQCVEKFDAFASLMREYASKLERILPDSTEAGASGEPGDLALLPQKLEKIISYLESFESDEALACTQELCRFTYGEETDDLLAKAKSDIETYNYDEAIGVLRRIKVEG